MLRNSRIYLTLTGTLMVVSACQQPSPPKVSVENVWSRPAYVEQPSEEHAGMQHGSGSNGVAYFTIKNTGGSSDRLLSVATEVCDTPELHTTVMKGEKMSMQKLDKGMEIPAGGQIEFKPRSHHVMLIDLRRSLRPDSTFALTLNFEKSGAIDVSSEIRRP